MGVSIGPRRHQGSRMLLLILLPVFALGQIEGIEQIEQIGGEMNSTYYTPPGQCLYRSGRPGFLCEDGGCIERGEVCNGRSLSRGQCEDGSDEEVECCLQQCITETAVAVCIPDDGKRSYGSVSTKEEEVALA